MLVTNQVGVLMYILVKLHAMKTQTSIGIVTVQSN